MNIYIYVSVLGAVILSAISYWGKRRGYYKKGNFWFDDIMHFSGGLLVAMFWSGITAYWPLVVSLTFLVGVLWEIYEYVIGRYKFKKYGDKDALTETKDTLEDLICDTAGAFVWVLILNSL